MSITFVDAGVEAVVSGVVLFLIGYCVASLLGGFAGPAKPVVPPKWKIGDVVRMTSGSPRYHIESAGKTRGFVTIVRMNNSGSLEHFYDVHEDELVKDTPELGGLRF